MQLHDTHFHLDLIENPQEIIQVIEQSRIYTVAVTNLPELFDYTYNLTKNTKYIRAALGFHPELVAKHKDQLLLFKRKIRLTRYIGEVGLDNYNKAPSDYIEQKSVFEKIIEECNEAGKKIVTVHSRRSENDVISIIGPEFSGKIILHWYSGSLKELEKAISFGFYFSINFAMTQSGNGKKIIERIPLDKLLMETDGPFIKINDHNATPIDISLIYKRILDIKYYSNQSHLFQSFLDENFKKLILE
jgi:TatD DNase family protein